jgi:fluoride exporter
VSRHWVQVAFRAWLGGDFPWGTLAVNLVGCFLIGWCAAVAGRQGWSDGARAFAFAGLLGGFTTFSAFGLENLELADEGRWLAVAGYVTLSVVGGLALAWAGQALGRR